MIFFSVRNGNDGEEADGLYRPTCNAIWIACTRKRHVYESGSDGGSEYDNDSVDRVFM